MSRNNISATWTSEVRDTARGTLPTMDNGSISGDLVAWNKFRHLIGKSAASGQAYRQPIMTTYSLVHTSTSSLLYNGGVVAPNGDIHFIPGSALVGQKINCYTNIVSTYSLARTNYSTPGYAGGVLAPNGDLHFVPDYSSFGQKINVFTGVVSTYTLVNTLSSYKGGVVSANGEVHFALNEKRSAATLMGQKISTTGVVSTYSYPASIPTTVFNPFDGAVLSPAGEIYIMPNQGQGGTPAVQGVKISTSGVVSTFSRPEPTMRYNGGGILPDGSVFLAPQDGTYSTGRVTLDGSSQSISTNSGSTFASMRGGVVGPDGRFYFTPWARDLNASNADPNKPFVLNVYDPITRINTTYSLPYTHTISNILYSGGVLAPTGDIYFIPATQTPVITRVSIMPGIPFGPAMTLSPFYNKY